MTSTDSKPKDSKPEPRTFIDWFRSAAPYVHAHRGRTFVIVFGGEVLRSKGLPGLVHDVALLNSLGVRLVLVAGARPQIDERLSERGVERRYHGGLRVTDAAALKCVKEAAGTARVELEALLSMGLPDSPMEGARLRVATGNFVTARPVGVIDGVDYGHTGAVRRVDARAIEQRLDSGAIALLSPIGYSVTGEAFNVSTHDLAASAAVALDADKLICLVEGKGVIDGRRQLIGDLTVLDAKAVLATKRRFATDVRLHLASAVRAVEGGVPRAHLVPRKREGGLLVELFTREGAGTLVTPEAYEGVRAATHRDVGGVLNLIEPLAEEGVLIERPRELLENDIARFTVIERDGLVLACAAVYPFAEERCAELACVAVHPRYRADGRGDILLAYIEKRCRAEGIDRLFVLTTQTAHWFQERGFRRGRAKDLPVGKRSALNRRRGSKVFTKRLS